MVLVPHEEIRGVPVPLRNLPRFLTTHQVMSYLMANQVRFAGRRLAWIESSAMQDRLDYANCVGELIPFLQKIATH